MSRYFGFTKIHMLNVMAWRSYMVFIFLNGLFIIVAFSALWSAVYVSSGDAAQGIKGYLLPEMITYVVLMRAIRTMLPIDINYIVPYEVVSGKVALDLIKPADYQMVKYFGSLGGSVMKGAIGLIPLMAIGYFFYEMPLPPSIWHFIAFPFSVLLSFTVYFFISFMFGLLSFWVLKMQSLVHVKQQVEEFLGGGLLPLPWFPAWGQAVTFFLPFQAAYYLPIEVYMGRKDGTGLATALGLQIFWVLALFAASSFMYKKAVRKLEIQGG